MIFVTVGTHEQPFNRLVEKIDRLVADGNITEKVIIQTGYSTYIPKHCEWEAFFPFQKMSELVEQARIVITHGGPSSFIMPLQMGKVPIVVPRQQCFGEHVNDHQKEFCKALFEKKHTILLVDDVESLYEVISTYDKTSAQMSKQSGNNNALFCAEFEKIVNEMMG